MANLYVKLFDPYRWARTDSNDYANLSTNTFAGYQAGNSNTIGNYNTFSGYQTGLANTTGALNTFVGYEAGYSNTAGNYNTFVGPYAGYSNTTGGYNTFVGPEAGYYNTTGTPNVMIGFYAGANPDLNIAAYRITTDTNVILIGRGATKNTTNILDNIVVIGNNAYATVSNSVILGNTSVTTTTLQGTVTITTAALGNGSAAAPSLAFTNSTATGLFMAGTNILGVATAGAERMRIDASGNVGIGGMPSGSNPLEVIGSPAGTRNSIALTGSTTGREYFQAMNTGGNAIFMVDSSAGASIFTGSLPYSTIVGSANSTALHLATTQVVRATIDALGNVAIGSAALATNATSGFLYIDTCAGAPTGVPTAFTGRVPLIYDTANNNVYIYNGAWKKVALA